MRRGLKRLSQITAIIGLSVMALWTGLHIAGARFNPSKSVAQGLYWQVNQPIEKGAYVLVCPPNTAIFQLAKQRGYLTGGFCEHHYSGMMKWVAASTGDEITISQTGIQVNGELLPHSKPLKTDPGGRPMPQIVLNAYRLKENELLLIGDVSPASFDSRYFGLIDRAQIKGVVKPVWTW